MRVKVQMIYVAAWLKFAFQMLQQFVGLNDVWAKVLVFVEISIPFEKNREWNRWTGGFVDLADEVVDWSVGVFVVTEDIPIDNRYGAPLDLLQSGFDTFLPQYASWLSCKDCTAWKLRDGIEGFSWIEWFPHRYLSIGSFGHSDRDLVKVMFERNAVGRARHRQNVVCRVGERGQILVDDSIPICDFSLWDAL